MARLLIALLLVFPLSGVLSQPSTNLALIRKLDSKYNPDEKMFLLVQGDVEAIKTFTKNSGGSFIGSAGDIASVNLPMSAIVFLLNEKFVRRIGSDVNHYNLLNDTMRMRCHVDEVHAGIAPLGIPYKGSGTLIGIIDSGIDYSHPDFQDSTGKTRIKWLWDMALPDSANSPQPYDYGQEFSGDQIDSGLAVAHTGESQYGHGTYVTGIAAGNGSAVGHFQGVAPEANLIIVSYDFVSVDTVPRYAHAVEYIFNKALALGMPCVINASLGDYYGPHDGLDLQSQYISNLIGMEAGRVVVAAAGNIGVNLPFHVGRNSVAGDTAFTWFAYNAVYGGAYIQLFADTADFNPIMFSIGADKVSPDYSHRGSTPFTYVFPSIGNVVNQNLYNGGNRIGRIQTYTSIYEDAYSIEIYVIPDSIGYYWRFTTTGNGHYDSWSFDWIYQSLPADTTFPDIVHYHAPDTLQSIVNGMACLDNVITVGNYFNTDRHIDVDSILRITPTDLPEQLASNSSRGPTRDGRIKPEITAPGHHIISTGVLTLITGLLSTDPKKVALGAYHITGGGTSASAPVIAGVAALYLEQNPTADWQMVKQAITNCAYQDNYVWGPIPNNAWGFGKVNAFDALTLCGHTVGTNDPDRDNLVSLYPNPAVETIRAFYSGESSTVATILDVRGREISRQIILPGSNEIQVKDFSNGFYFLVIPTDEGNLAKTFIVSR